MAYATDHLEFTRYYDPAARKSAQRGFFGRIYDAIQASGQRRADRDIAAYIAHSGGGLTDSIEREMMERVSRSAFGSPLR